MNKKIPAVIAVSLCALLLLPALLAGCGEKISDPWLDRWQEVVIERSAVIEKAEVHYSRGPVSSIADPELQTTYDADRISDMLDALSAPVESFYLATESEDRDKKDTSHDKITAFLESRYQIDFYIRGEAEPFTVMVALRDSASPVLDGDLKITDYISDDAGLFTVTVEKDPANPVSVRPAVVFYEIDESNGLQCEQMADIDALTNTVESILNIK